MQQKRRRGTEKDHHEVGEERRTQIALGTGCEMNRPVLKRIESWLIIWDEQLHYIDPQTAIVNVLLCCQRERKWVIPYI